MDGTYNLFKYINYVPCIFRKNQYIYKKNLSHTHKLNNLYFKNLLLYDRLQNTPVSLFGPLELVFHLLILSDPLFLIPHALLFGPTTKRKQNPIYSCRFLFLKVFHYKIEVIKQTLTLKKVFHRSIRRDSFFIQNRMSAKNKDSTRQVKVSLGRFFGGSLLPPPPPPSAPYSTKL